MERLHLGNFEKRHTNNVEPLDVEITVIILAIRAMSSMPLTPSKSVNSPHLKDS